MADAAPSSTPSPADVGPLRVVAINGSPSHPSRSRSLAERALAAAGGGELIDLAALDPGALLALRSDPQVDQARDLVADAQVLIVATPVYRATYTALTKAIFDLLPQGAFRGTAVVPIATGYGPHHALAIDHGLRPLIASLDGLTVPTGVYATNADLDADGTPSNAVAELVERATAQAIALARALT